MTALLEALALAVGMIVAIQLGAWVGRRRQERDGGDSSRSGLGAIEGAVFALLGLVIAFTFSGALQRFDARRALVIEEANAIDTAYMRLDLLDDPARSGLQDLFRRYLDSRLAVYAAMPDGEAVEAALERSTQVQREVWDAAVAACRTADGATKGLVLGPINAMIDLTTVRTMALLHHTHGAVQALLFLLALGASFLAGTALAGASGRSWAHVIAFALLVAAAVYVVLDMEYPRSGLIRVDSADRALNDVKAHLASPPAEPRSR